VVSEDYGPIIQHHHITNFKILIPTLSHTLSQKLILRSQNLHHIMPNDAVLRTCLLWLAAVILAVGIFTHSFKKMMVTYVFGVLGIAAVLLPDWDYFNRDFSRWTYPVTAEERANSPHAQGSGFLRCPLFLLFIFGFRLPKFYL